MTDDVLFHYTSQESLQKIVESRRLRLTNVYYVNDSGEISFAMKHFQSHLKRFAVDASCQTKEVLLDLDWWIGTLLRDVHSVFTFSLSRHRNLLSQWRAYTSHGCGVSIGFDPASLRRIGERANAELVQCVYGDKDRERIMSETLRELVDRMTRKDIVIKRPIENSNGIHVGTMPRRAIAMLLKTLCRIKDPMFSEEGEFRLVSECVDDIANTNIMYRPGKTTLVPYIEVELESVRDDGYLFDSVYIGPSPNLRLSMAAISAFLKKEHACTTIYNSNSGFREI